MSTQPSVREPGAPYPPPLDQRADREFSFHPSVGNLETNLWRLIDANWSEFLVENQGDQTQVWVPRRYLGEVSASDRPVMIVGLSRSLDYKAGQVWPVQKRVIEMPRVPAGEPFIDSEAVPNGGQESMLGRGFQLDSSEKKVGKLILFALAGSVFLVALVIFYYRGMESGEMVSYKPVVQESLGLGPEDDYFAVVRRLGTPQADRWKAEGESLQYRVLEYPWRNLNVILAGRERKQALYVGALDRDWKVIDSVNQKGGSNTYRVLSKLPKF
jgi:hypothetical protein